MSHRGLARRASAVVGHGAVAGQPCGLVGPGRGRRASAAAARARSPVPEAQSRLRTVLDDGAVRVGTAAQAGTIAVGWDKSALQAADHDALGDLATGSEDEDLLAHGGWIQSRVVPARRSPF